MSQRYIYLAASVALALLLASCGVPTPEISTESETPAPSDTEAIHTPDPTGTQIPDHISGLTAPVVSLSHDLHNPDGLFSLLATNDLFYSQDRGSNWDRLPLPAVPLLYDEEMQRDCPPIMQFDIRPSQVDPDLLWVRAGQKLFRSDDAGQSWQAMLDNVISWTVSEDGSELYAMRYAFTSGVDGLYRSHDSGKSWDLVFPGLLPDVAPSTLRPLNSGCFSITQELARDSGDIGVYLGGPGGIYRSFDQGKTWEVFNKGLPIDPEQISEVPLIVNFGDTGLYAMVETGSGEEARPHLIRLERDGDTTDGDRWQLVGEDFLAEKAPFSESSFFGLFSLVPDPEIAGQLYMGCESGAFVSRDSGQGWQPLDLPEPVRVTRIAASVGDDRTLYLWTGRKLHTTRVP